MTAKIIDGKAIAQTVREELKGRMIGTMNLINWIGIMLSALFYQLAAKLLEAMDIAFSWIFFLLALALLPTKVSSPSLSRGSSVRCVLTSPPSLLASWLFGAAQLRNPHVEVK